GRGGVGADAEWAVVHLGYVGRHQLPLGDRPGGWAAHGLMGQRLRVGAVEIRAIERQSRRVGQWLAAEQLNDAEEELGSERGTLVQNAETHQPAVSASAASPA